MRSLDKAAATVRARVARRDRHFDPFGRTVLITGGTRGLGLELAREFGKRGARVAILGRDAIEGARAEKDLTGRGIEARSIVADVRVPAEITAAVETVRAAFGAIDILVNNAGIIQVAPLDALTLEDYRDAMETHFWAPLHATNAVLPEMRARRAGRIVNIASIGGRVSVPHLLPYSASKFALAGWSEGMRAELVRERVYVTTVIPGLMRTGSPENAQFKGRNTLEYAWFAISDSLPGVSVDVTAAERQIVEATLRGDAVTTISWPAKLAAIVHGIVPSLIDEIFGVVARFLPSNGGIGTAKRSGRASHSAAAPSPLTIATQRRAHTQNEVSS